jgi:hypothetical protein
MQPFENRPAFRLCWKLSVKRTATERTHAARAAKALRVAEGRCELAEMLRQHMTDSEIATALGITKNAVKKRRQRMGRRRRYW